MTPRRRYARPSLLRRDALSAITANSISISAPPVA